MYTLKVLRMYEMTSRSFEDKATAIKLAASLDCSKVWVINMRNNRIEYFADKTK